MATITKDTNECITRNQSVGIASSPRSSGSHDGPHRRFPAIRILPPPCSPRPHLFKYRLVRVFVLEHDALDFVHAIEEGSISGNLLGTAVRMKVDGLEITVSVDGRPLREFQRSGHGTDMRECYIVPRSLDGQRFRIHVRDDTSRVSDHYDLRAEIVITVDGREVYRTRQCVLLQDISEYEFTCSRTCAGSVPFFFASAEELQQDARRSDGLEAALGRVEVCYRRFHRAFDAPPLSTGRSARARDERTSAVRNPGATLDMGDSSVCSLEPVWMTFRYVSEPLLDVLLLQQNGETVTAGHDYHFEHASGPRQWTLRARVPKL